MKYDPQSSRESTLDHYGKRGIGWHGCLITFHQFDKDCKVISGISDRRMVYIDHILQGSNKQDTNCVLGILESIVVTIIDELPYITSIKLQYDNSVFYQSHFVIYGIEMSNIKYHKQLYINAIIHSETQDGKSSSDSHFETSNRHLK